MSHPSKLKLSIETWKQIISSRTFELDETIHIVNGRDFVQKLFHETLWTCPVLERIRSLRYTLNPFERAITLGPPTAQHRSKFVWMYYGNDFHTINFEYCTPKLTQWMKCIFKKSMKIIFQYATPLQRKPTFLGILYLLHGITWRSKLKPNGHLGRKLGRPKSGTNRHVKYELSNVVLWVWVLPC